MCFVQNDMGLAVGACVLLCSLGSGAPGVFFPQQEGREGEQGPSIDWVLGMLHPGGGSRQLGVPALVQVEGCQHACTVATGMAHATHSVTGWAALVIFAICPAGGSLFAGVFLWARLLVCRRI